MFKNKLSIVFLTGLLFVIVGILYTQIVTEDTTGILLLAIGMVLESLALMLYFWKKIKNNTTPKKN
jgi:glucose uptake protein GlcU